MNISGVTTLQAEPQQEFGTSITLEAIISSMVLLTRPNDLQLVFRMLKNKVKTPGTLLKYDDEKQSLGNEIFKWDLGSEV